MPLWEMIAKLVVSMVLGGLVGIEREAHERPAGLRTHILVCLGSTLFALATFEIAGGIYDPGRIAAQIVTGIGFLGAGTILRRGSIVRGLTTAASIWTVAAIGISVAIGGTMMYLAVIATVLVVGTLTLVRRVEGRFLMRSQELGLSIATRANRTASAHILMLLAEHDLTVKTIISEEGPDEGLSVLRIRAVEGPHFNRGNLSNDLATNEDVISYNWE